MKRNLLATLSASPVAFVTSSAPVALQVCHSHLLSSQGTSQKPDKNVQIFIVHFRRNAHGA